MDVSLQNNAKYLDLSMESFGREKPLSYNSDKKYGTKVAEERMHAL